MAKGKGALKNMDEGSQKEVPLTVEEIALHFRN